MMKNPISELFSFSVCYGLAHGYNFDAISCESCKAFFRRNALYNTVSWRKSIENELFVIDFVFDFRIV